MVSDDFDFGGVFTRPAKAEAPLIIDADAVLSAAAAFEGLQAFAGRKAHNVESAEVSSWRSFRRSVRWMSGGKCLEAVPAKSFSVSVPAKLRITTRNVGGAGRPQVE